MAQVLKGDESLDKEGKLDGVGDTNFKKVMEVELGRNQEENAKPQELVNGVPVKIYRL